VPPAVVLARAPAASTQRACRLAGLPGRPPTPYPSYTGHVINDEDFEGTLVLEQLAQIQRLEDFMRAVDADDFPTAEALMRAAGIDSGTIATVLQKMHDGDDER